MRVVGVAVEKFQTSYRVVCRGGKNLRLWKEQFSRFLNLQREEKNWARKGSPINRVTIIVKIEDLFIAATIFWCKWRNRLERLASPRLASPDKVILRPVYRPSLCSRPRLKLSSTLFLRTDKPAYRRRKKDSGRPLSLGSFRRNYFLGHRQKIYLLTFFLSFILFLSKFKSTLLIRLS